MASTAAQPADSHLKRSLSHGQMTMIVLGSALGTGLFLGSGSAITLTGPAIILSYAIGSMIAAVIGGAAGEMAVRYPVRGGFGSIATRYLSPYAGFLTRWAYWTATCIITGLELVAVSSYLTYWWPQLPLWVGIVAFGLLILALNIRSVKHFGATEFLLSSVKVFALVAFILVGLCLIFFGVPGHEATGTANLVNDGGFMPNGFDSVWLSLAIVMFSFGGIEMISISAAEAQDPARSVRTSAKAMMWRLATFYVLSMFIVASLVPWQTAAALDGTIATSPFVMVFAEVGVPAAASITNFVVLVAALSAANANLYASSRLMHSMAGDRMAPHALAQVSSTGIPVRAMMVSLSGIVLAVILAVVLPTAAFGVMITLVMVCALTVWVLILLAYIAFKRIEGNSSAFRLWGGRLTAGAAILALFAIWVALFRLNNNVLPATVGVVYFVLLTILYFAIIKHQLTVDEEAFSEARQAAGHTEG
ncbi:amino acid permease [Rothia sp. ZJ1223]|uniref:amino acid permease n=1 Tax=Rothia sp. ZJ1223 TaxID=2811098 RepID=UPI001EF67CC8|nr:amino acid permease [Rothia sp. ZJ1223]